MDIALKIHNRLHITRLYIDTALNNLRRNNKENTITRNGFLPDLTPVLLFTFFATTIAIAGIARQTNIADNLWDQFTGSELSQ